MDLQETIVLRIKREIGSHLATNYRPKVYKELLTYHRRGPMEVVNPSVMVSRLDLVVLDSAAAG